MWTAKRAMLWTAATGSAFGALATTAGAHHEDVFLCGLASRPAQLVTGAFDDDTSALTLPRFVFETDAEDLGVDAYFGDQGFAATGDPGELPAGYVTLPGLTDIRFDFRAFDIGGESANLWFWDPLLDEQVQFEPASGGMELSFQKPPASFFTATVDGSDADVSGFVIDKTSGAGLLHKHLTIVIDDGDDDGGTPVRAGVYLVSFALAASPPPPVSDPVFLVVNAGLGAEGERFVEQAIAFVEGLITPPCPGDLDGDAEVTQSDLGILLADYGCTGPPPVPPNPGDCRGDADGDGDTDQSDLGLLLSRYGKPCGG